MQVRVASVSRPWAGYLATAMVVLFFANFIALAARLAIWPPFSPVPITGQTLAVLLTGLLLGPRRGVITVLVYLAEGAFGLPVFAGGFSGLAYMIGPTGGYLVSFIPATALAGWMTEAPSRQTRLIVAFAFAAGSLTIYLGGALWLDRLLPGGIAAAVATGVLPYLVGDLLKGVVAVAVLPSARSATSALQRELEYWWGSPWGAG